MLFSQGEKFGDFTVVKSEKLDEINLHFYELIHIPSNAKFIHLETEERENVFFLLFPTPLESSNGVAHILEHCVLTGSKKYPIRDPFFAMTRRSLSTFMNAFTGLEWTGYPFSTLNEKDYYNLLEVYLDACFFPTLSYLNFRQEGHRFTFKENDPQQPLEYTGVVYQEMMAANKRPMSMLFNRILEMLMSDTPYRFNSGGDSDAIPSLTYEEFRAFHQTFYSPSNAIFFTFGNQDYKKTLHLFEEHALKKSSDSGPRPVLKRQKRFFAPQRDIFEYDVEEETKGETYLSLSWLTTGIEDQETALALILLDSLLMEHDGSLLRKKLIESGLCKAADSCLETDLAEIPYILFCLGTKEENAEAIERLILNELQTIVEKGFPQELIDASLHSLKFERLELSSGNYPLGLNQIFRCAFLTMHHCNPLSGLRIHALFKQLQTRLKKKSYLPSLIQKYFLDNPHRLLTIMRPKRGVIQEEERLRREKLDQIQASLSSEEVQTILDENQALKALQEKNERAEINQLPTIHIEDISEDILRYPLTREDHLYFHECFTNGILYLDITLPLPQLTLEQMQYAELFTTLAPELGTKIKPWDQHLAHIQRYTGGINAFIDFNTQIGKENSLNPKWVLSIKGLRENSRPMTAIVHEILTGIDTSDKKRISDLIRQLAASAKLELNSKALKYAEKRATRNYSLSSLLSDELGGLPYYQFILQLEEKLNHNIDEICAHITDVKEKILHLNEIDIVVAGQKEGLVQSLNQLLLSLEKKTYTPWVNLPFSPKQLPWEGYGISNPVAFNALAIQSCHRLDRQNPFIHLATRLLTNTQLHRRLREQAGAYGANCFQNSISGCMVFKTYRDPNIFATYSSIEQSITCIAKGDFSEDELREAKIQSIARLDHPVPLANRAYTTYSYHQSGLTDDLRLEQRRAILQATKEEVKRAVCERLIPTFEQGAFVTLGNPSLIEADRDALEKRAATSFVTKRLG